MKTNSTRNKLALGVLGLLALGIIGYAATVNILTVGTIPHSEALGGPGTITFRTIALAPGEVSGWHYHPGPVFNVVTRGTVNIEDGCGGENVFTVGQAFENIGGRIHRAKNLGTEESFEYNTFIIPQGSPLTVNIPNNERRCGPPRNIDQCKDGGWVSFTHPRTFGSQGDCQQYLIAGK
jgi:quercetin dioxygenase-like cupin family protein